MSLGCCLVRILTVPVLKVCVTRLLFSAYTDGSCVESDSSSLVKRSLSKGN